MINIKIWVSFVVSQFPQIQADHSKMQIITKDGAIWSAIQQLSSALTKKGRIFMAFKIDKNMLALIVGFIIIVDLNSSALAKTKVHFSIDGMSWDMISSVNESELSFYSPSSTFNIQGRALVPFATTNTGPAHASLYSNLPPGKGGWVGNTFLEPGAEFNKPENAFSYPQKTNVLQLPQLLEKQNKKTACINVPSIALSNTNINCTLHLGFSRALDKACHVDISNQSLMKEKRQTFHELDVSHCFMGRKTIITNKAGKLTLTHPNNETVELQVSAVNQILFDANEGLISKLIWINNISDDGNIGSIYIGPSFSANANKEFHGLPRKYQSWAGTQDSRSFIKGMLSREGFIATLKFQANYIFELTEYLVSMGRFDAIFSYTSMLDTVGHNFSDSVLVSEKSPTKTKTTTNVLSDAYLYIDYKLSKLMQVIETNKGSIFVTSDHGMSAARYNFGITSYLESLGFNTTGKHAELTAYSSGATLHIYLRSPMLNKKMQSIESNQSAVDFIIEDLKKLTYEGKHVFEVVLPKERLDDISLAHRNAGDIVAITRVGFGLETRVRPTARVVYRSTFDAEELEKMGYKRTEIDHALSGLLNRSSPGIHGHLNTTGDMQGVFFTNAPVRLETGQLKSADVSSFLFCKFQDNKEC